MSQENVEIVQRHIEAFNRRDMRTWLATFHPDAEIDWSRARGPFKGVYRGQSGHEAFWDVWLTFDWGEIETYDLTGVDSEVVVPNATTFRGREGETARRHGMVAELIEVGESFLQAAKDHLDPRESDA